MKVVYVAGPFRSVNEHGAPDMFGVQKNIMSAMAKALEVWQHGGVAICPHSNTMFFTGSAPDEMWLEGDLELLRRSDAVLLTDDWERSSGSRAEVDLALYEVIPVFGVGHRPIQELWNLLKDD